MITEDVVERAVEKRMDRLDARLMAGVLSQNEYDQEVRILNKWAEREMDWAAALERHRKD